MGDDDESPDNYAGFITWLILCLATASMAADDGLGDLAARRAALSAARAGQVAGASPERAGLDVRGDGTVGAGFAAASEALGWLRSDSHQDRLRRLREKYGYDGGE